MSHPIDTILPSDPALALLVFLAETTVVTLSTVRTIFIARGWKGLAPVLGFFEVSIWLFAIGKVMQNLTSPACYLAFASGFSLGNFLGILIEKVLALGSVVVHAATKKEAAELVGRLRSAGFGVTRLDGRGGKGPVQVVFTAVPRRELEQVLRIVREFDPQAFYAVHDLQAAAEDLSVAPRRRQPAAVPGALRQVWRVAFRTGAVRPNPDIALARTVEAKRVAFDPPVAQASGSLGSRGAA